MIPLVTFRFCVILKLIGNVRLNNRYAINHCQTCGERLEIMKKTKLNYYSANVEVVILKIFRPTSLLTMLER